MSLRGGFVGFDLSHSSVNAEFFFHDMIYLASFFVSCTVIIIITKTLEPYIYNFIYIYVCVYVCVNITPYCSRIFNQSTSNFSYIILTFIVIPIFIGGLRN